MSGFVCEAFGYIPRTGERIKVVLEKEEVDDEYTEDDGDRQHQKEKEKTQIFQIEVCFVCLFYFLFFDQLLVWIF